jgi:hypothetical protein
MITENNNRSYKKTAEAPISSSSTLKKCITENKSELAICERQVNTIFIYNQIMARIVIFR